MHSQLALRAGIFASQILEVRSCVDVSFARLHLGGLKREP